jgi:hypothetical protein
MMLVVDLVRAGMLGALELENICRWPPEKRRLGLGTWTLPLKHSKCFPMVINGPKMAPDMTQDGTKMDENGPKMAQDDPNLVPRHSKIA